MQVLCDFDMIRHISEDLLKMKHSSNSYEVMATSKIQKVFIHGFYLYYVVCEQNVKNHKYTKDYCEVSCWLQPLLCCGAFSLLYQTMATSTCVLFR